MRKKRQLNIGKIIAIVLFGIAFGLVEAMVVIYLRQVLTTSSHDIFMHAKDLGTKAMLISLGFVVFLKPEVLSFWDTLHLELFREAATIIMLLTLSYVAGKAWRERFAYFLLSFAVWDIFYYIWLHLFIGWPKSLFDVDILFLIPVPWVAPVVVPIFISIIMILFSVVLLKYDFRRK